MARTKKDGDATPKASRRTTATPNPEVNATQRAESGEPTRSTVVEMPSQHAPTLPVHHTPANAEEEIRRRAYEMYEQEGRQHGRDREHWLRAEAEVLGRRPGQKSA